MRLENFQTFDEADLVNAKDAAVEFLATILRDIREPAPGLAKPRPYCLSLLGTNGSGKTYLAKSIWRQAARLDCQLSSWVNWPDIVDHGRGVDPEQIEDLAKDWFVVLDEIGGEQDPWKNATSDLSRLLRMRTNKWTIITSNRILSEMSTVMDPRIASFLVRDGNKVCEVRATDYAFRKGIQ